MDKQVGGKKGRLKRIRALINACKSERERRERIRQMKNVIPFPRKHRN
jgi:hypothetical protein